MSNLLTASGSSTTECVVVRGPDTWNLSGVERTTGRRTELGLAVTSADRRLRLQVDGDHYELSDLDATVVRVPGMGPETSLTTITAAVVVDGRAGTTTITVDCGREPPELAVAMRVNDVATRWSSWAIDHDIQHDVLDYLKSALNG